MNRLTHMMSGTDTITLQQKSMNQGAHIRFTGDNNTFTVTKIKHDGTSKTRLVSETPTSVNFGFFHRQTSKINTGRLKPMIKPFDSGWNYIPNILSKLISLLVIWSCYCSEITMMKVTQLSTSIVISVQ